MAEAVSLKRGETLFHQGDKADALFVLESGAVRLVRKPSSGGDQAHVATLAEIDSPGALIGEMGVFIGKRTATAQVLRDAKLKAVRAPEGTIERVITATPSLGLAIARTIAGRLKSTSGELRESLLALGNIDAAARGFREAFQSIARSLEKRGKEDEKIAEVALWAAKAKASRDAGAEHEKAKEDTRVLEKIFEGDDEKIAAYPDGAVICREGDPGDRMFLIVEGAVEVFIQGERVETAVTGQVIGEIAVLLGHDAERAATCKASGDTRLGVIPAARMEAVVTARPKLAVHLGRILSGRLATTDRLLTEKAAQFEQALAPVLSGDDCLLAEARALAERIDALGESFSKVREAAAKLAQETQVEGKRLLDLSRKHTGDASILKDVDAAPK